MNGEKPEPREEEMVEWLAACDEALARGADGSTIAPETDSVELQARLDQNLECVRLLRQAWSTQTPAEKSSTPAILSAPDRIGRFELRRELGRGAYGVVFLAYDPQLHREVALKTPKIDVLARPALRARFEHEARAAALLDHSNVAPVYEAGSAGPILYMAMAYCPGPTLGQWLARAGRKVSLRLAAALMAAVADGVQHAHSRGVLHRDLKPGNILLVPHETATTRSDELPFVPKVADFGLAKVLAEAEHELTQSGAVLGTLNYMSPEQSAGRKADVTAASDIYSLGAILYQLLAGRPPFESATPVEALRLLESQDPPAPSRARADVPLDLETICLKCLRREPINRYSSAGDLARDLRRFLAGESIEARRAGAVERVVKWVKRRRSATALVAMTVLVVGAGLGLGVWFARDRAERKQLETLARNREFERLRTAEEARQVKIGFYTAFVRRWGVPEGIGPVAPEQVERCGVAYKFYRRGGRVERLDVVNGSGQLTTQHQLVAPIDPWYAIKRECRYDFKYDLDGRLTEQIASDQADGVIWRFHYPTRDTGHFTTPQGLPRSRTGSGATYAAFVWTPEGFEQEIRYLDPAGRPKPDVNGIYAIRREFDQRGLAVRRVYLGLDGRPVLSKRERVAGFTAGYDDRGNEIEWAYFGVTGEPVQHRNGQHRGTSAFDVFGNQLEKAYFGSDGRPTIHTEGFHCWRAEYDHHGNQRALAYFGIDGRPTLHRDGYARLTARFDARGSQIEEACFGVDGEPVRHKDGHHRWTAVCNERGVQVEWACFDVEGQPLLHARGYHKLTATYDARGNQTAEACFGLDGQPLIQAGGFQNWTAQYDDRGNQIEWAVFDDLDRPVLCGDGFHKRTQEYDLRDNLVAWSFFDADGLPARHRQGDHHATAEFDEQGNKVAESFFGLDGQPVVVASGFARWRARFDDRGHLTEMAWFGTDDRPLLNRSGYARLTAVHNDLGDPLDVSYFGVRGEPVLRTPEGYARFTAAYDARGNCTEVRHFGTDGFPALFNGLYARVVRTYDNSGRQTGEIYYGIDGQPVLQGFIRDWLVLAPIPFGSAADGGAALAREQVSSEAELRPRAGDSRVVDGKEHIWTIYRAAKFHLDFNELVGRATDDSVAYAVCYIIADADTNGLSLNVGSDDGTKVYLNGREVLNEPQPRGLRVDDNVVPNVSLNQGTNVLLIKVFNGFGVWSACVRFADAEGNPVTDLRIALSPP